MLVFIDESGDSGLKINSGSSRYFTISLVIFKENDEAAICNQRIEQLKKELDWNSNSEFHFKNNSNSVREKFFKAVNKYNFSYYCVVIDKELNKLWGNNLKDKESFYNYACGVVFEKAKEKLNNAIILIDKNGSLDFRRRLEKYLKFKINSSSKKFIKKIKMEDSQKNNLLQLADYIAGAINRSVNEKNCDSNFYRKLISNHETDVQIRPN